MFGPVVATVSATSVAPLPLAIEVGLKVHVAKAGRPEQAENAIVEGKLPPDGTTCSTKPAACPGVMVCEAGDDVIEKSTEFDVIAKLCETWFVSVPVAATLKL